MNRLDIETRAQIIGALVEGNSIRAVSRMVDVSRNTINKLLLELGAVCSEYMNKHLVNLTCERVQCDEIWSFIAAKQRNVTPRLVAENPHAGDVWTWVAMDADTKLICTWMVGNRDSHTARVFVKDLKSRLANRVQLTTDGLKHYFHAVAEYFDDEVDYAMLIKIYGGTVDESGANVKYSPAQCLGCEKKPRIGRPDPEHISTSYIERQNLTMRMQMRRFTRLTNAHSKKIENHIASIAIHYMHYNFVRIHSTLRVTPAMAAGISDHVWEIQEIISLLSNS
jgi:IS1 family transposase